MNSNSKDALKLKHIVLLPVVVVAILFAIHFVSLVKNVDVNILGQDIKEISKIEIGKEDFNRNFEVTSRSISERFKEVQEAEQEEIKQEETKYISIEEIQISKDMDLSKRCGISKEDFKTLIGRLKPDSTKFFYDNADTIYDLCEKYEINEIFFCGLIAGESGWKIASNHRNACNYISMMSKGKLIRYSTPAQGLEAAAKLLHNKYLTEGGAYYCGKTIYGVQKRFCPDSSTWVGLIYGCMKQIVK